MPRTRQPRQAGVVCMNAISVLDSEYETELRMLLLMYALDRPATIDYLAALDTLSVNAKTLYVGQTNLNGAHRLASGELKTRISLARGALRTLILKGLVELLPGDNGLAYQLTATGITAVNRLNSPYASALFLSVIDVLETINTVDDAIITSYVAKQSSQGGEQ